MKITRIFSFSAAHQFRGKPTVSPTYAHHSFASLSRDSRPLPLVRSSLGTRETQAVAYLNTVKS
jgi:hypothetical protein